MKRWHFWGRGALGALLGVALAGQVAADSRDLTFDVRPLFEGTLQPESVQPLLVSVSNRGPNARGMVSIRKDGFSMSYPIELPRGSAKRFIAYTAGSEYSMEPATYDLLTNQGDLRIRRPPSYEQSGWVALTISDASGVGAALRVDRGYQLSITDVYGKPGALPERVAGYAGCAVVVLGDGAERMSDVEVGAIQDYALLGGSIVVFGGASTPLLADPRWRDWLPIVPEGPKTIRAQGEIPPGLKPEGTFTLTPGKLRTGAVVMHRYAGENFVVKRTVGKGRVVFIAVNLFEQPARNWKGTDSFFAGLNFSPESQLLGMMGSRWDSGMSSYPASTYVPTTSSSGVSLSTDPFQAQMPSTSTILSILLVYFVLVVPINLLVLRKMGRGELAWVTSPIISLVFAGVFFQFASGLYSADLSTAVNGTWIVDEVAPRGQFVGKAQMFIPRGGSYDLGFEGVGHVTIANRNDFRSTGQLYNDLRAFDDGQIRVPNLGARNLSFHEFSFQQVMPGGRLFAIAEKARTLTYTGSLPLRDVRLVTRGGIIRIGDLAPGATVKLAAVNPTAGPDAGVRERLAVGQYAVLGQAPTVRPGPQIGRIVEGYSGVRLEAYGTLEGEL